MRKIIAVLLILVMAGNLLGMLAANPNGTGDNVTDNVTYELEFIEGRTDENRPAVADFTCSPLNSSLNPTTAVFDTGPGTYPSVPGTHNGTITPNQTITVQRLYTYPSPGSGGHTEFVKIWGNGVDVNATWNGYAGDWHNISFPNSFILEAGKTYNYTIRTGSYPQIIHKTSLNATGGTITCIEFVDVNGITYTDWIPAIRLEGIPSNLPPTAVLLNTPTEITDNSMLLSWSQNADTDFANYTIYHSTASEDIGTVAVTVQNQSATLLTVHKLLPGTTYYFTVRVYDISGLYNDSNQVNGTTLPGGGPSGGPYYHQIYSATSTNGINWTANNTLLFDHASVPGAVYFDSKLYLYFVNAEDPENEKLSVGISEDRGATFTVHDVQITGSNSPYPVDPNPIIDGSQIRLTYLGNFMQDETNKIVTATSSDGTNFIEEGIIFTENVFDPDLFYYDVGSQWVLFVSNGTNLIKATSSSPNTTFTKDTSFSWTAGGISSTHKIGSKYYTYYAGMNGISVAEYSYGTLSNIADGIVAFPNMTADPTVAIFGQNDYKMFFKTMVGGGPGPGGVPPLFSGDVNDNLTALFDEYNNSIPKDVLITWLNDTGNQMLEGMVGPMQHKLYATYSLDGVNVNGTVDENGYTCENRAFLIPNASVPDAVVSPDNTTIRLYFVDAHPTRKIINALSLVPGENVTTDDLWFLYNEYYIGGTNIFNTAKSTDGEKFTFECMRIVGLSEDYMVADPSIVLLENGSYRIYFLYVAKSELPEGQGDPAAAKNHTIACAYSPDGVNFTFEGVCYSGVYGECLSDPEVFKTGEYYRLYLHPTGTVSSGNLPFRYVNSTDGGRTFTGTVVWIQIEHMFDVAGCGCRIVDTGDGYRIYFDYNGSTASAFSSDGINWVFDEMPKVGGRGYMAAVKFKGMYFLYFHA
ncbi:MAG: fibronectin type III domain-containing protein [Thermoplasmatales archaeon]|nr:fibronectin type III domain-containing protein [Thermoplasmatales archaeon]